MCRKRGLLRWARRGTLFVSTRKARSVCFSNEPGLYDFDSFGVRLEDCLYMTDKGPAWFTVPPDSLDEPLGRMA